MSRDVTLTHVDALDGLRGMAGDLRSVMAGEGETPPVHAVVVPEAGD